MADAGLFLLVSQEQINAVERLKSVPEWSRASSRLKVTGAVMK